MIEYEEFLKIRCPKRTFEWSERDAILYALALGIGRDPRDPIERNFIYEKNLKVMPTFATVAAWGSNPSLHEARVDYRHVVHAAQSLELHQALPQCAKVRGEGGMTTAIDKGDKGALLEAETVLRDVSTGVAYATNKVTWFARADGHFGGPRSGGEAPSPMPDRPPDRTINYETRLDQAALYRLCGDRNPLHIDPEIAQAAGFPGPILHGLCTFGLTCRAVLEAFCAMAPDRLAAHSVRFSGPVIPGDLLTIYLWRDKDRVSFEAHVLERGITVIRNGQSRLRSS